MLRGYYWIFVHSWQCSRDRMRESEPDWLHTRKAPYPPYYLQTQLNYSCLNLSHIFSVLVKVLFQNLRENMLHPHLPHVNFVNESDLDPEKKLKLFHRKETKNY